MNILHAITFAVRDLTYDHAIALAWAVLAAAFVIGGFFGYVAGIERGERMRRREAE